MPNLRHLMRRLALSETARDRLARVVAGLLIAVIVVCVVIVVLALAKKGPSYPRTNRITRVSTTPDWPTVVYKNCAEAHKDGRWNIPEGDPAYRPALDKNHDGVACESRDR